MSVMQVFEDNMKQKQVQLQQLRENLLRLIEEHPDSPEAEKWKHMLAQIGMHPSHPKPIINSYLLICVHGQVQMHTLFFSTNCELKSSSCESSSPESMLDWSEAGSDTMMCVMLHTQMRDGRRSRAQWRSGNSTWRSRLACWSSSRRPNHSSRSGCRRRSWWWVSWGLCLWTQTCLTLKSSKSRYSQSHCKHTCEIINAIYY